VKEYIEKRALEIAQYIIETGSTVREAARAHKVSKSTVHKDMSERLPRINVQMYKQVKRILEKNKAERHIRGGKATYLKYKNGYKKPRKVLVAKP
jgi:putative DeoR family transcriptional regulator (stage III sporulation protein D)